MTGSIKGFVSLVKKENKNVITTHCFLHREALVAKTLGNELRSVLNEVVKMVNYVKSRPLKSRLFAKLCEEIGSRHVSLLLHTEVRWLSRGKVLPRVFELKEELLTFFTLETMPEFCELLSDETWCAKLGYLADIFEHLNKVNSSMQGKTENILTSADKVKALTEKIAMWKGRVEDGNMDPFPWAENNEIIAPLISQHLEILEGNIMKYFPDISVIKYDWLRNPFIQSNTQQLSLKEVEELTDIRNDRSLKLKHSEVSLETFWLEPKNEFPQITKQALTILLQFSTSYLCELGFSCLTNIRTKKRS